MDALATDCVHDIAHPFVDILVLGSIANTRKGEFERLEVGLEGVIVSEEEFEVLVDFTIDTQKCRYILSKSQDEFFGLAELERLVEAIQANCEGKQAGYKSANHGRDEIAPIFEESHAVVFGLEMASNNQRLSAAPQSMHRARS